VKITRFLFFVPLVLLPGCLVTQSGNLEVLNPKQAYGRTVAIIDDVHGENADIEKRLASDLQKALTKRGLAVAEDPSKAEIVIVPTLGRMRERAPAPVASPELTEPAEAVVSDESAEPVVAAPAPEARPFRRFSSANVLTRGDLVSRGAVPSARTPPSAQQAGLLLTGYRGEDFRDYGTARQSLPPVWRIYVSQPAVQMKWNSVAVPLINAAASAARPLGETKGQGTGSVGPGSGSMEEQKEKKPAGEQPESRKEKKKDQTTDEPKDEEPRKRKFFGLFGSWSERDTKEQEPEQPEADEPR
jgi:hypothetical protein